MHIDERLERIEKKIDDGFRLTNGRIRSLEVWRGYLTGALAALILAVGIMIKMG